MFYGWVCVLHIRRDEEEDARFGFERIGSGLRWLYDGSNFHREMIRTKSSLPRVRHLVLTDSAVLIDEHV